MNKFLTFLSVIILMIVISVVSLSSSKTYFVDADKCISCELCVDVCPNNAIQMVNGKAVIDIDKCNNCGECTYVCPTNAINYIDKSLTINNSNPEVSTDKPVANKITKPAEIPKVDEQIKTTKKENIIENKSDKVALNKTSETIKKIYKVIPDKCISCRICVKKCPVDAIEMIKGKAVIDTDKCIECGICEEVCPTEAIIHEQKSITNNAKNCEPEKSTEKKVHSKKKEVTQKIEPIKIKTQKNKIEPKSTKKATKIISEVIKQIYKVIPEKCISCRICVKKCPVDAIEMINGKAVIDTNKCIECGICEEVCPTEAIIHEQKSITNNAKNCEPEKLKEKKVHSKKKEVTQKIEPIKIKTQKIKIEPKSIKKSTKMISEVIKQIYKVIPEKCISCRICVKKCPVDAIEMINGKAVIDTDKCIECGICEDVCPTEAIIHEQKSDLENSIEKVSPKVSESKKTNISTKNLPIKKVLDDDSKNVQKSKIEKVCNFFINKFSCVGCEDCISVCPVNAIEMHNGKAVIDQTKCINCGLCVGACTYDAIDENITK